MLHSFSKLLFKYVLNVLSNVEKTAQRQTGDRERGIDGYGAAFPRPGKSLRITKELLKNDDFRAHPQLGNQPKG